MVLMGKWLVCCGWGILRSLRYCFYDFIAVDCFSIVKNFDVDKILRSTLDWLLRRVTIVTWNELNNIHKCISTCSVDILLLHVESTMWSQLPWLLVVCNRKSLYIFFCLCTVFLKLIMACLECLVLYYWFMSVPTYFLTVHDDVKARQVLWSDLRLLMSEESIVGYKEWRVTLIPLKCPDQFLFFFAFLLH